MTDPGRELLELTSAFDDFIRRHHDYIETSRRRYVEATGEEMHTRVMVGRLVPAKRGAAGPAHAGRPVLPDRWTRSTEDGQ
ncbi:MAG: hypothetical protein WDN31_11765 [Hyphomicrobium sp.]